ncbi:MAG: MATE family efflux transporter [Peptoanaerobacter stomatis]
MKQIRNKFFKYVSLNIMSMMGLSFYILADTFFIANGCGSDGLAALNIALPAYGFMFAISNMIGVGFGTRFKIGFDDYELKCSIFSKGVFFALLLSSIFLLTGLFFASDIAYIMGARDTVLDLSTTYLKVILVFTPAFMINSLLISFIRNDNHPSLSMKSVITSSIVNTVFDYIFIFPFDMGMFGAAIATGISPIVGIAILSTHFMFRKNSFKLKKTKIKLKEFFYLSSLGISSLINEISSSVVIIVFNLILLKYSSNVGVAAYGVVANIALVVVAIFNGVGNGIQPIISENYAKKDFKSISYIIKLAIITEIIISVILYAYMYINAEFLTNLFNSNKDATLLKMAVEGITIYFLSIPFTGINMITATSMQAMEKPRISFIISILRGIIIIVPLSIYLSSIFMIRGMWGSYTLTEMIVSLMSIVFIMKYGKNKE